MTGPMVAALVAAVGAAGAAALLTGPAHARLRHSAADARSSAVVETASLALRLRPLLAGCAFVGAWVFVGGTIGMLVGGGAAVTAWRVIGGAESPAARRQREELERALPLGVDLLATCLSSGAAVEGALQRVADAVGGRLGDRLLAIRHRLALGVDPASVWEQVAGDPVLGPLGRSIARSYGSGASVVDAVESLSADLRERARTDAEVRANSVDVKAAAPLGACFLPAFVLLGVVPLVAGVVGQLELFG